jgi:hypothetical protein
VIVRESRFPPFTLMAVRGQVTSLLVSGNTATFEGAGVLQTGIWASPRRPSASSSRRAVPEWGRFN